MMWALGENSNGALNIRLPGGNLGDGDLVRSGWLCWLQQAVNFPSWHMLASFCKYMFGTGLLASFGEVHTEKSFTLCWLWPEDRALFSNPSHLNALQQFPSKNQRIIIRDDLRSENRFIMFIVRLSRHL